MKAATKIQPKPNGKGVDIARAVCRDIEARARIGKKKYGQRLRANNGRNALLDAYQESLDLAQYLKQKLVEEGIE